MRRSDLKKKTRPAGRPAERAGCWTLCLDRDNTAGRLIPLSDGLSSPADASADSLQTLLHEAARRVLEIPEGEALLFQALDHDVSIALIEEEGTSVRLDVSQRAILIPGQNLEPGAMARSPYFRHQFLAHLIEGLRAWDQTLRCPDLQNTLRPDQALLMARAAAADRLAIVMLCAFRLRQQGAGGLWRHLLGSSLGDIAGAFARRVSAPVKGVLDLDPDQAGYNEALLAWYRDSARVGECDHRILEDLDAALGENKSEGHGKNRMTARHLKTLCERPGHPGGNLLGPATLGALLGVECQTIENTINQAWLHQIMRDQDVVRVSNVPFRDVGLARRIFPEFQPGFQKGAGA